MIANSAILPDRDPTHLPSVTKPGSDTRSSAPQQPPLSAIMAGYSNAAPLDRVRR